MTLLNIFSPRTTRPISTKRGANHPWVKGIQVCSNEDHALPPRRSNLEIVKPPCQLLKIFSSRTTEPILISLCTNDHGYTVIHFSSNEGPNSSQNREISGQVLSNNKELFKFRIIIKTAISKILSLSTVVKSMKNWHWEMHVLYQ